MNVLRFIPGESKIAIPTSSWWSYQIGMRFIGRTIRCCGSSIRAQFQHGPSGHFLLGIKWQNFFLLVFA
jgi:hypothetical protein